MSDDHRTAVFGAGCFWQVEAAFRQVPGVVATAVGFMGGHVPAPSYRRVCRGDTGHAEVAQVTFDPDRVPYRDLLEVFWDCHDPTQLNRQGPDVGEQYRSVIFTADEAQAAAARRSLEERQASGRYRRPIVTAVEPAGAFHRAEEEHQRYLEKRGMAACTPELAGA